MNEPSTTGTGTRPIAAAPQQFALTRWSVVLAATDQSAQGREALEQLCKTYWQPIYAFVRRQGHSPADAQDFTQEFFARLLRKHSIGRADPAKGKFRSFLLAALKHFLANEWDKARAQKRGGGERQLSIDVAAAETSYRVEPVENVAPDNLFERRWAVALLNEVMKRLRAEYEEEGKTRHFEALKGTLTRERGGLPYAEIAAQLNSTEGAVKVAVHRLRQRYRDLLRQEIAQTVTRPEEVDEEIRSLFAALQRP